jgi:hypothetical protein
VGLALIIGSLFSLGHAYQSDDILVNDDTFWVSNTDGADVACDSQGNFIVTWLDSRFGGSVFARRYNASGNPLGVNFMVNDDTNLYLQSGPAVAASPSGTFVVVWQDDQGTTDYQIFAKRYSSSGSELGPKFKVNDNVGPADQEYPAVAIDSGGNFVIAWQDQRNGNYDIYTQRYSSTGSPIGSNFKVNDDPGTTNQTAPAVGVNKTGAFVIVWRDTRNGVDDVYSQRYNSNGSKLGANLKVNSGNGTATIWGPSVALDDNGNFMVTWRENPSKPCVAARRYYPTGNPVGPEFQVNEVLSATTQDPDIAINSAGNFVITWKDYRDGSWNTYAQRFNDSGIPQGSNLKVSKVGEVNPDCCDVPPAIAMKKLGNFVIVWDQTDANQQNVLAQRCRYDGILLGDNFRVNELSMFMATQFGPEIAANGQGDVFICWNDWRAGVIMYMQRFGPGLKPSGVNFPINPQPNYEYWPEIAGSGNGNFVTVWENSGQIGGELSVRIYNSSGLPLYPDFSVAQGIGAAIWGSSHAVASDISGNFVVVWYDDSEGGGNYDVYARRFNAQGIPLSNKFKVNDHNQNAESAYPDVAMNESGAFVIAWKDKRATWDIYAQRYSPSGIPLGPNIKVSDVEAYPYDYYWWLPPALAIDNSGNFIVTWYDEREKPYYDPNIYAQRFDSQGNRLGSNFRANDDYTLSPQISPDIAINNCDEFIIVWEDHRDFYGKADIYAQKYNSSGVPVGVNFRVTNPQYDSFYQIEPAIAVSGSYFYFTWMDNRRAANQWDIYAKFMQIFNPPRGDVNGSGNITLADVIYLVNYIFRDGPDPIPEYSVGDSNCDGQITLVDIIALVNHLFKS